MGERVIEAATWTYLGAWSVGILLATARLWVELRRVRRLLEGQERLALALLPAAGDPIRGGRVHRRGGEDQQRDPPSWGVS